MSPETLASVKSALRETVLASNLRRTQKEPALDALIQLEREESVVVTEVSSGQTEPAHINVEGPFTRDEAARLGDEPSPFVVGTFAWAVNEMVLNPNVPYTFGKPNQWTHYRYNGEQYEYQSYGIWYEYDFSNSCKDATDWRVAE